MSKFKVGDRATIIHYSIYNGNYRKGASFTIKGIDDDGDYLPNEEGFCNYYDYRDLTLASRTKNSRRTFKQLKDSISVKKGALWQEACDDGTQEYVLLDQSFNRDPRQVQRIYDRSGGLEVSRT